MNDRLKAWWESLTDKQKEEVRIAALQEKDEAMPPEEKEKIINQVVNQIT